MGEHSPAITLLHKLIGDIVGKGLLIGVELVKDRATKEPASEETKKLVQNMLKRGVIMMSGGKFRNRLRIQPPLVITKEQIDYSITALNESLTEIERGL